MSTEDARTAETQFVETGNVRFAYRRFNQGTGIPVVFTNHFMGNLDTIDPSVIDGLAATREVIVFDSAPPTRLHSSPRSALTGSTCSATRWAGMSPNG
jgi:hypothetical protein